MNANGTEVLAAAHLALNQASEGSSPSDPTGRIADCGFRIAEVSGTALAAGISQPEMSWFFDNSARSFLHP